MKKLIIAILFCAGCSVSAPPAIDTKPPLNLKNPEPVKMRAVKLGVATRNNVQEKFSDLENSGQRPVLITLSAQDYKNLAVNIQQLKTYIKTQQKIIKLYKQYYEGQQDDKTKN